MGIEFFFEFRCQGVFIKKNKWSCASIACLRQRTDTVAGGRTFKQHLINLRCILLADLHAEGFFKLLQDGRQSIDGVALSLGSPLRILTHLLAPEITVHIVGESH